MEMLVTDFSGTYGAQGFLQALEQRQAAVERCDFSSLDGTCCYCDPEARSRLEATLPGELPRLRFLDSGDYHYMSLLLALRETEPFSLVLLDNHPDNQEPVFPGVLSCGSWVRDLREEQPLLREVLTIGPEGCPEDIPEGWLEARREERLYVSLDKDIMDRAYARTDWSQGRYTLSQVKDILGRLMTGGKVVAADVCGEVSLSKGATPEDLRINLETNVELYKFIINHLK